MYLPPGSTKELERHHHLGYLTAETVVRNLMLTLSGTTEFIVRPIPNKHYHSSKLAFHRFNGSFSETSEVWGSGWDEVPSYHLGC